ncbi:unnamed protein product [Cylicocyclus nassatus]|uniref:Uncharacterized protein n=1 Tax=Cylicocyclus nassatus TaxID=53992 RepID=A0AA36GY23_CYLNA|nr:unnamed protein product [Cylicocyclus nassatus]
MYGNMQRKTLLKRPFRLRRFVEPFLCQLKLKICLQLLMLAVIIHFPNLPSFLMAMLRTMAALLATSGQVSYIDASSCSLKFSYAQDKTPDGCALLCDNDAVRQEYSELRSQLKPGKTSRREPNLLRRKTTGQSNFYMLGRATRAVEMTRAVNLNVNFMDGMVVVAARMGSLDVASAFAEGPASSNGHERSKKLALGCFSSILQVIACSLGNLEIAEILIAHGALIMAKDHKKRAALSHAIINGQEHCAAMLLAKGADFLKGDSSNNTPAHYAAAYGWLECLKLLTSVDPSCLKQENDWKLTPLSIAYLKGHYGIVQWLLDEMSEYVDINGKDMEGVTLLSSLLRYTDEDAQSELLEQNSTYCPGRDSVS